MKLSNDGVVQFDPERHIYTNLITGNQLESVTTYINRFKNKFDSEYWGKREANKTGETLEQVLQRWKDKASNSCNIGTDVHRMFEDYVNGLPTTKYIDEKCLSGRMFINDFYESKRLIPVQNEIIVYNDNYAGQIDNLSHDNKGNYYILDYKTNDKIESNSYGKYMLDQYANVPDSTFYHYSLQLDCYSRMIDIEIKNKYIIHIKNDGYDIIPCANINHQF